MFPISLKELSTLISFSSSDCIMNNWNEVEEKIKEMKENFVCSNVNCLDYGYKVDFDNHSCGY